MRVRPSRKGRSSSRTCSAWSFRSARPTPRSASTQSTTCLAIATSRCSRGSGEWLRPGAVVLLAIEDDDQPGIVTEWLGAPMFFCTNEADEERRLVERAGLEVLDAEVEHQVERGGEAVPLASRAASSRSKSITNADR